MNTQNDFLDNAVDDELAIDRTEDLNAEMCSYMQSDTEKMCSSLRSDTCGERMSTTSEGFVKILDFRHFERFFTFSKSDRKTYKKAISDGVNVSVVLDMVCGNTSKQS